MVGLAARNRVIATHHSSLFFRRVYPPQKLIDVFLAYRFEDNGRRQVHSLSQLDGRFYVEGGDYR
jgi:hypothetical protein